MDSNARAPSQTVHKHEEVDGGKGGEKKSMVRTLNRVPRACNACRKQKMRCEGADSPPCKRCRHAGLECLFEKPSREASLTGEAGLERIRSLEAHVADIRHSQSLIQNTLLELVNQLRTGGAPIHAPSPASFSQQPFLQSPGVQSIHGTQHGGHARSLSIDTAGVVPPGPPSASITHGSQASLPSPMINNSVVRHQQGQMQPYNGSSTATTGQMPVNSVAAMRPQNQNDSYNPIGQAYNSTAAMSNIPQGSNIHNIGAITQANHLPPMRSGEHGQTNRHLPRSTQGAAGKRAGPPISSVTSPNSSDVEDDENDELPASGLVAPWEVLRGLANVAVEQAAKENVNGSLPPSRARTPEPDRVSSRPTKRRKTIHQPARPPPFPDVVTKNIISEHEARELFRVFYHGCSTFLPVFDANVDTYDYLHERSPFAVNCICMVAAIVRDGGGVPSETFLKCQEEVHNISQATLFLPVTRQEPVRAMILVSGWSDNGWLTGGHAVRMAMELSMHKAWPRLLKRMQTNKAGTGPEDRELIVCARTWFCLYLFEHQMSYGTGRPAILKDDESIWQCRQILRHPLSIEDDMRLVSTVELMALRERLHNKLSPLDRPIDDYTFNVLREGDAEFQNWYASWDASFSQKYEDAAFYRQSLQIQHLHAELYHNSIALRNINGPRDVQNMPPAQRKLALRTIHIARTGLELTVTSPAYREGMKYAVHYTQATATFTASFLLRLARLFPDDCDILQVRAQVEQLAQLMSDIPGKRYALTLKLMLKRSKKRHANSQSRSPRMAREPYHPSPGAVDPNATVMIHRDLGQQQPFSPTYDAQAYSSPDGMQAPNFAGGPSQRFTTDAANIDYIWRGFEMTSNEQLPVWLSDQNLGGTTLTQNGLDAFLLPPEFLPPAPQVW